MIEFMVFLCQLRYQTHQKLQSSVLAGGLYWPVPPVSKHLHCSSTPSQHGMAKKMKKLEVAAARLPPESLT